jgi:hypothetical protein
MSSFYMSEPASRELIKKLYEVPVMNKPTVAQLGDPQWWGVWASEDATHYSDYYGAFVKPFDLDQWVVLRQGPKPVVTFMDTGMLFARPESCPARPAAPEYDGTGFPPVGTECEFRIGGGPTKWHLCTVRYILAGDEDPEADGWRAVVWCPHLDKDQLAHLPRFQFRTLRSQAERDREEFVTAALRVAPRPADDEIHPRQYLIDSLNALYDTGKFMRRADK